MNMVETDRQVHHSSERDKHGTYKTVNETPFIIGLKLHIHNATRNKTLIDQRSGLNLCASYDKVIKQRLR